MAYARRQPALAAQVQQLLSHMASVFGGGGEGQETIGMDTMTFMLDMPLLSILQFQESAFPRPVEELVDDLLKQAYR